MSAVLNIFCETDFLESFFDQVPATSLEELSGNRTYGIHSDWDNAWLFIANNRLYLDKSVDVWAKEILEKKGELDQFDWAMLNVVLSQQPIIYSEEVLLNTSPSAKELNACYLLGEGRDILKQRLESWGVLLYTSASFVNGVSQLSRIASLEFNVKQNENYSWFGIREKLLPELSCNSMIIVDPYIANNSKYNLPELFQAILPSSLPKHFELTIITSNALDYSEKLEDDIRKGHWIPDSMNLQVVILDYKTHFSEDEAGQSEKRFHDRSIMTNYYKIDCGKGFSLKKKNKKTQKIFSDGTTKLSNRYIFTSEERNGFFINLEIMNQLIGIGKQIQSRLLSYIEE